MPLSIGKVRVDVGLCGAIPRSCWSGALPPSNKCQSSSRLSDITSSNVNTIRHHDTLGSFLRQQVTAHPTETKNRSKTSPTATNLGDHPLTSQSLEDTSQTSQPQNSSSMPSQTSTIHHQQQPSVPHPPRWAVPARGGTKLEPVCEALGSHHSVDLASRPFFRVGRSPGSDVQLLHNTSSRQHAMLFHHPNGSCYVVDCGSSHGTFVNGVRVRTPSSSSMVIPHRVRRGSLIRFGGPGAPSFVLKSFTVGFSSMVKDYEEEPCLTQCKAETNPRLVEGGILKKRSFDEAASDDEPDTKRQRCMSPPLTQTMFGEIRLVSPDSPRKSKRVSFHDKPHTTAFYPILFTPDELSSDEEACTN